MSSSGGTWTRWLALAGALFSGAACTARLSAGTQCAYTSDCSEGLSCVTGFCRGACVSDRDCASGASCVLGPNGTGRVCVAPASSSAFRPLCGSDGDCAAEQGRQRRCVPPGVCVSQCAADPDCQLFASGATCGADALCHLAALPAGDASACASGTACGLECVYLSRDPRNCGACGRACGAAEGGVLACVQGVCTLGCTEGSHFCSSGCVSNADTAHCGVRCDPCPARANATARCDGVQCLYDCAPGFVLAGDVCVAAMDAGGPAG